MNDRAFPIADILTLATGRLLSRRHMAGLYDIANYMTGDDLMTHQLPRAMDMCRPALLAQHPRLDGVEPPENIDVPDLMAWLANVEREHGETLPVKPLGDGVWEARNPIEEACDLVGPERVYVAPMDSGEQQ